MLTCGHSRLVEDGPDVIFFGRKLNVKISDVSCGICVVLVPEMSPIGSMKSAVVSTFLPALSEVCSLAVLAGGGGGGSLLWQTPWQW